MTDDTTNERGPRRGRVEGKVAIVTGGAGGIGRAIVRRLGLEGARVMVADLASVDAGPTLAALEAEGIDAAFVALDVSSEASWKDAVAGTVARYGRLDVLVNNAGIAMAPPESFESISFDDWRRVLGVNLDGTFLGMREAVVAMRAGGGSIVNIGSVAAYVGTPGGAAYGASKGAMRTLTRQAAVACAKKGYGVRINTVHPMYVWTPMAEANATRRWGADQARQKMREMHPFGCLGEPDDIAWAVLFLASDESRLVNGTDLVIDGGQLAT